MSTQFRSLKQIRKVNKMSVLDIFLFLMGTLLSFLGVVAAPVVIMAQIEENSSMWVVLLTLSIGFVVAITGIVLIKISVYGIESITLY